MTLGDIWVKSDKPEIKAGKVSFAVKNEGATIDGLAISPDACQAERRDARRERLPRDGRRPPGRRVRDRDVNLEPGSYELVCFMAGHYAAGQTLPFEVEQSGLFPSLSVSLGAAPFGARFRPCPRASLRHVDHSGTILNRVANHLTRAGLRSPVHDLLCASTAVLT